MLTFLNTVLSVFNFMFLNCVSPMFKNVLVYESFWLLFSSVRKTHLHACNSAYIYAKPAGGFNNMYFVMVHLSRLYRAVIVESSICYLLELFPLIS